MDVIFLTASFSLLAFRCSEGSWTQFFFRPFSLSVNFWPKSATIVRFLPRNSHTQQKIEKIKIANFDQFHAGARAKSNLVKGLQCDQICATLAAMGYIFWSFSKEVISYIVGTQGVVQLGGLVPGL